MKQWCDWSDLMSGKAGAREDPKSKPLGYVGPTLKKGEIPRRPSDAEVRQYILKNAPRQPTDQEMFGGLVVSEEELQKKEKEWENKINNWYKNVTKPIEIPKTDWGRGPIHKETLTEEEERIRLIPISNED